LKEQEETEEAEFEVEPAALLPLFPPVHISNASFSSVLVAATSRAGYFEVPKKKKRQLITRLTKTADSVDSPGCRYSKGIGVTITIAPHPPGWGIAVKTTFHFKLPPIGGSRVPVTHNMW
jgi:hypothetical protein